MRKIKNKKNSREGRWQVAVWNRGAGVIERLPPQYTLVACIGVYIYV